MDTKPTEAAEDLSSPARDELERNAAVLKFLIEQGYLCSAAVGHLAHRWSVVDLRGPLPLGLLGLLHSQAESGSDNISKRSGELAVAEKPDLLTLMGLDGTEKEIDDTLERLGVGIDRETEKMDDILSRLRRTRIAA